MAGLEYYCAFVKPGFDRIFRERAQERMAECDPSCRFYSFSRQLWIGKAVKRRTQEDLFFPGYVFFGVERMTAGFFERLRGTEGFMRVLQSNTNITRIENGDLVTLQHFLQFGERHPMSRVEYDENDRIRILSGDMANFEGRIKKIDRRRQRATVQLDGSSFFYSFDLCYTVVEKTSGKA